MLFDTHFCFFLLSNPLSKRRHNRHPTRKEIAECYFYWRQIHKNIIVQRALSVISIAIKLSEFILNVSQPLLQLCEFFLK